MLIYFQITILEKQLKSLTERIRLFNTLKFQLPSKRGNHMLSTCLSLPSVFEHKQDQSHQPMPYPLIFRKSYGEELKLSPILLCRFIKRFGARAFERHLVSTTLAEIKLIYYTSIK